MSSTPPSIHAKDRKFQKFPRKPDMLLQENLKKQTAHCLQSGLRESLHGWKIAVYFISHLQPRTAERDALDPGSAPHGTGSEMCSPVTLCLAVSHFHSPCSCQARLSARLSLYSQQPLNEPALGVVNYTVLCVFVIPESWQTQPKEGAAVTCGHPERQKVHPNCFQHLKNTLQRTAQCSPALQQQQGQLLHLLFPEGKM